MFRYHCIAAFIILFFAFSYIILPAQWMIGKFSKDVQDISCFRLVQAVFRVVLKISGVSVTTIGEENVPDGAVLYVSNHRSVVDIPLTYVRCKNITGYVAKDEIKKIPALSRWMRHTYCLFLDRSNPRSGLATVLEAVERINAGISVFVFPEGTRSCGEETDMLPFKNGSFKIATKSGCPIVPIAINNSAAVFERQAPRVKKAHVVVEYGKPVYPDKLDKYAEKNIGDHVRGIIAKMLVKNAGLV